MSRELAMVLFASAVILTLVVAYRDLAVRRPRRTALSVFLAALSIAIYVYAFPDPDIKAKAVTQEVVAVALCYVSMLLGMIAQYFYKQADRGEKTFTFAPLEFMMPIFASPIVFIPLLTVTQNMALSDAFAKGKLMVYLIAFQNGFFWKSFFEQRQKTIEPAAAH